MLSGHVIDLGANPLNAQNAQANLLMNRVKQPVVTLEGTWTSPGLNNMTLTNGETPFEYHLSIAQVNPGDPVISGFIKVDDILPAQGQEKYEATQQQVLVYLTQDGTVSTKFYDPRVYTGLLDRSAGTLQISNWLNGSAVTWSPAEVDKVKNFMEIAPVVFKETTLGGAWTSDNGDFIEFQNFVQTPELENVVGNWDQTGVGPRTFVLLDAATHQYEYTDVTAGVTEVRQIQFTEWDGPQGICLMTETRPSGTAQFEWNPQTFEFEHTSGLAVGYN